MTNTIKREIKSKRTSETYTHTPRIASFKRSETKKGFLEPVNKRAHKLTGKRKYVTAEFLKPFDGYHDIKVYTSNGTRRSLSA